MSAVKLRDFFENQSNTVLSSDRKAQIFAQINKQTQSMGQNYRLSAVKNSWYFKMTTTAALAFMLTYLLYAPISKPLFTDNGLLIARKTSTVQAGYVGTLFATEGQITIVRNGVTTTTSQLQGGDSIYLYNTSKADFILRDGSRGSIEGPAQLTIMDHEGSGLTVSVDHARYMQIDKAQEDTNNTDAHEDLTIETNTSRITTHKDDRVHLAIVTTQDRQFIQNKGDEVAIQSIMSETNDPVTQQLANSHVAEVTDDIRVYTQVAAIYDELKTQSSSQTYDLNIDPSQTIDAKLLLALDIPDDRIDRKNSKDTKNTSTSVVDKDKDNDVINSNTDIVAYQDTTTTANTALFDSDHSQVPVENIAVESIDSGETNQPLSYQETKNINILLSDTTTPQPTGNTTSGDTSDDLTLKITSKLQPLEENQIKLIMKLSSKCIHNNQLEQLQQGFSIDTASSLDQTIEQITSQWYLTPVFTTTLTSLKLCDNDNQN